MVNIDPKGLSYLLISMEKIKMIIKLLHTQSVGLEDMVSFKYYLF